MDEFKTTEASGFVSNYTSTKKSRFRTIYDFIPTALILFVLGVCAGVWMANVFHNQKIVDSIKLQRFLYKTIVYNITPNIDINK
jgi:hypothetical protein